MFIRVNQCLKNEIGPFVPSCPHKGPWGLSGYESIMQRPKGVLSEVEGNKPNFLNPKTNPTLFAAKVYETKHPPPNSKKQTQTNPIPPHRESIENRVSSIKYPALFMQNKPNSPKAKTNATSYATRIYPNIPFHPTPKNKAKTNPIPAKNSRSARP